MDHGSNPFTEEKKDAMQEVITGTVGAFTHSYAKSFGAALVDHLRQNEASTRNSRIMPTGVRLVAAPDPTEVIYSGWLEKKGAWNKGWKKRWFVCFNKDKNFIIKYYASETNLKKSKGEILLDGYSLTTQLSESERKDCGEFCLKLTCGPASKRREWFVRGASSDAMEIFVEPFKNACTKARAGFKAGDAVEGAAFEAAFNDVRFAMGLVPAPAGGTEEECLAGLVADVAMHEVMGEVLDGFSKDIKGRSMKAGAEKAMHAAIMGAVGAAWLAAKAVAAQGRGAMAAGIMTALDPIQQAEEMLFGEIEKLVKPATNPAMELVKGGIIAPMVAGALQHVTNGYHTAIKVWARIARQITEQTKANADNLEAACNAGYSDYWGNETVDSACSSLESALDQMGDLLNDFSTHELSRQLKDAIYNLISRGIATYAVNIKTGSTPNEAYSITLGHVVHDAQLLFSTCLKSIIFAIAMPSFNAACKDQVAELAQPIEDLIPDPVVPFLSVHALIDGCMDRMVGVLIDSGINELAGPELEKIQALGSELA
jgi:hypothetical protein